MAEAAQPRNEPEESPLSPWWMRSVWIVMIGGFAGLLAITELAYRNAPPIPGRVLDANGTILFTADDIRRGQAVFLRYGLMDNGTIWGHGGYLGPDYSAESLHRIGENVAAALAKQQLELNYIHPTSWMDDCQLTCCIARLNAPVVWVNHLLQSRIAHCTGDQRKSERPL